MAKNRKDPQKPVNNCPMKRNHRCRFKPAMRYCTEHQFYCTAHGSLNLIKDGCYDCVQNAAIAAAAQQAQEEWAQANAQAQYTEQLAVQQRAQANIIAQNAQQLYYYPAGNGGPISGQLPPAYTPAAPAPLPYNRRAVYH